MNKKYGGRERRRHKRYPYRYDRDCTFRFCRSDTKQFEETYPINISHGGILFVSPFYMSVGDSIDIEISYYAEATVKTVLQGSILWTVGEVVDKKGDKVYYIGFQFNEMSKDQKNILQTFIDMYMKD